MVTIAVTSEAASEPRVAISPEAVKKYVGLGAQVRVEAGAGLRSRFSDEALAAAGATITSRAEALAGADFLLSVRRPSVDDVKALKPGAIVCSILSPYDDKPGLDALVATGASLVFGTTSAEAPLKIVSLMPENGVIFSDGVEQDYLAFTSGITAEIGVAERVGRLVV